MQNLQELAAKLAKATIENGGATLSTATGEAVQNGYTIGGGILYTADAMAEIPADAEDLEHRIFWELATSKGLENFEAVGTWLADGVIYLDAVTVERNFIKAAVLGISRKQQAFGELKNGSYTEHKVPATTI